MSFLCAMIVACICIGSAICFCALAWYVVLTEENEQ